MLSVSALAKAPVCSGTDRCEWTHTPVSPMTAVSSGLSQHLHAPLMLDAAPPALPSPGLRPSCGRERQWEPWCLPWETIPVHNAAPLGSSLLLLWALRDFQQGKQILLALAGCSGQPHFLGCVLPSWSFHVGQHPHKEGTRACQCHQRQTQHSELGDSIPGGQRCAAAQPQPWPPPGMLSAHITPQNTPQTTLGALAAPCTARAGHTQAGGAGSALPCTWCPGPGCVS